MGKPLRKGLPSYLFGLGLAVVAAVLLTMANLAVGIIGNEENPLNRIYWAVIAVGVAGSLIARFRPGGMALALAATATAQVLAAVVAQMAGHFTWVLTAALAALWLGAAWLLRRASKA